MLPDLTSRGRRLEEPPVRFQNAEERVHRPSAVPARLPEAIGAQLCPIPGQIAEVTFTNRPPLIAYG
jgi:hypothetical protein